MSTFEQCDINPDQVNIQNLTGDLENKQGADRIPILLLLAKEYGSYTSISLQYASEARDLSLQYNRIKCLANALMLIIEAKILQGLESEAIQAMVQLRKLDSDRLDDELRANILSLSSRLNYISSNFTQAINDYYAALELYQRNNLIPEQIEHMKKIGILATNKGDIESGLIIFLRCLALCREQKQRKCTSQLLNNTGVAYQKLGEYEKAIAYHKEALSIAQEVSDGRMIASATGNLGIVYHQQQQYKLAMRYYELAVEEASRVNQPESIALMNGNIGRLLHEMKQYDQAMEQYNKSLSMFKAIQNHSGEQLITIAMAKLFLDPHYSGYHPLRSISLLQAFIQSNDDSIAMPRMMEIHKILSKAYEKIDNPAKAYRYLKAYLDIYEQLEALNKRKNDQQFLELIRESEDDTKTTNSCDEDRKVFLHETEVDMQEDLLFTSEHYGFLTARVDTLTIIKQNPKLFMILGYSSHTEMNKWFNLEDFLHPKDRNLVQELITSHHLEEEEIYWENTDRFLTVNAVYNQESGNAFFMIRDISDQQDIKNRFQQTQSLMKSIINMLPINIFWQDSNSNLLGCNQAFSSLASLPSRIDKKTTIENIWPFQEFEHFVTLVKILKEERKPVIKQPVLETLHSGEKRWFEYTLLRFSDGSNSDDILVKLEDVSDIRKLMQDISENEVKYRTLFESSMDAIMLLDRNGFFDCNQQTVTIYGTDDKNHFIGTHPADFSPPQQPNGEDSYPLSMKRIEEAFTNGYAKFEWVHKRLNGEIFPAEIWLTRFQLENREVLQATVRDITEAKRIAKALQEARYKADQANKAKSEFLANMSHEIRTPLHAVLGFADLLNTLVDDENLQEYIQAIQIGGNSLLTIINEVLDLSKIEAGLFTLQYGPLSIPDLIKEVVTLSAIRAHKKNIQILTNIDPDIPDFIVLDATRMRQILLNLISNAVKFTQRGSVIIEARVHSRNDNHFDLAISVEDTGIGIKEENREKIFDPFYQELVYSDNISKGTGLGLTITKRFVELMNGTIQVQSTQEEGSRFEILFKEVEICSDIPGFIESQENNINTIRFVPATILVADESDENRRIIHDTLEKQPIVLYEAIVAEEALRLAIEKKPDLIMYSSDLPGMDVQNVIDQIRAKLADTKIIAMTVAMPGMSSESFSQMGFDGCLAKPFTLKELIRQLSRYLSQQ